MCYSPLEHLLCLAAVQKHLMPFPLNFRRQDGRAALTELLTTHVQYTQTDTIRQTDGPLVPMVRLVPIQNDFIPMALLVNMHLVKGT